MSRECARPQGFGSPSPAKCLDIHGLGRVPHVRPSHFRAESVPLCVLSRSLTCGLSRLRGALRKRTLANRDRPIQPRVIDGSQDEKRGHHERVHKNDDHPYSPGHSAETRARSGVIPERWPSPPSLTRVVTDRRDMPYKAVEMRIALPHLAASRPPPLRLAVALLVLGAAVAGAIILHDRVWVAAPLGGLGFGRPLCTLGGSMSWRLLYARLELR